MMTNRIIRMGPMEVRSAQFTFGAGEFELQMVKLLVKMVDGRRSQVLKARGGKQFLKLGRRLETFWCWILVRLIWWL
jgi:hypothetical protein